MPRRSAKGSPEIDIEGRLSGFVRRIRVFATGREIRMFKYQLASLSSPTVRLAIFQGDHAIAINTHVITSFDLWLHKNERPRALWPSTVSLSKEYFESLQKHGVPLNEADLAALAHTAMGLAGATAAPHRSAEARLYRLSGPEGEIWPR